MMNTNLLSFLHSFYTNNPFISQKRFFTTEKSVVTDPFSQSIPFNYSSVKNVSDGVIKVILNVQQIVNYDEFFKVITNCVQANSKHIIFVKIRFNIDEFRMSGNQFGFHYKEGTDVENLFNIIHDKLNDTYSNYSLNLDQILYIQISFKPLNKILESEFINTSLLNTITCSNNQLVKSLYNPKGLIPISINEDYLGKPLNVQISEGNITSIEYIENKEPINFLDRVLTKSKFLNKNHKDYIQSFDSGYNFYKVIFDKTQFVSVLAIKKLSYNKYEKLRFHSDGTLITKVVDTLDENNVIHRLINNKELLLDNNNKIINIKQNYDFRPVEKNVSRSFVTENKNIGVIDTETFRDSDGIYRIFAAGIKSYERDCKIFYIDSITMDSDQVVLDLINELLRPMYNETNFYCHNLGGYDVVFILNVLLKYENLYKINCNFRDDKIIKLSISKVNSKNTRSITIRDSYAILNSSQAELSKNFEVMNAKTIFPHKFSTRDNLFYIGNIPDKSLYGNIKDKTYNELYSLYSEYWNFKDELIKYLKIDLEGLYEILSKANRQFFLDYKVNMTEKSTISGIASQLFLNTHYNNNIPHINISSIYNDIKQSYYGGMTEVYKPYGENLYYYDVNSLYPYVALNPMPGLSCSKVNFMNQDNPDISSLFGFYNCEITTPSNSYIGLLPYRTKNGLTFPLGCWSGWYFSEELKYAQSQGYKIKVLNGYDFNRVLDTFKTYVDFVYNVKSNATNKTQKSIAKSLLNNLLGRFGIRFEKPITDIVSRKTFDELSCIRKVVSYIELSSDKVLVNYVPKLNVELINSLNLDIAKVALKYKDSESNWDHLSSVVISAAVTAYGRIEMNKIKQYILDNKGDIFYTDTDSIVTNMRLPDNMVDDKTLGKLKLEHKVNKGVFISGKTYCILNHEDSLITKAKGVNPDNLTLSDYLNMLEGNKLENVRSTESKRNYELGHVVIMDNTKTLDGNVYNKREKVYVNNIWLDTKPLHINSYLTKVDKPVEDKATIKTVEHNNNTKYTSILSTILFSMSIILLYLTYIVTRDEDNTSENIYPDFSKDICNSGKLTNTVIDIQNKSDEEIYYSSDESNVHSEEIEPTEDTKYTEEEQTQAGSQETRSNTKIRGIERSLTDDMDDLGISSLFEENKDKEISITISSMINYVKSMNVKTLANRIALHKALRWDNEKIGKLEDEKRELQSSITTEGPKDSNLFTILDTTSKGDTTDKQSWMEKTESFDLDKLFESETKNKPIKEDSIDNLIEHYNHPKNSDNDSE